MQGEGSPVLISLKFWAVRRFLVTRQAILCVEIPSHLEERLHRQYRLVVVYDVFRIVYSYVAREALVTFRVFFEPVPMRSPI